MNDAEGLNEKYFAQVQAAVNNLIDLKVALHIHDKVLDDQIDDFKGRMVSKFAINFSIGCG